MLTILVDFPAKVGYFICISWAVDQGIRILCLLFQGIFEVEGVVTVGIIVGVAFVTPYG